MMLSLVSLLFGLSLTNAGVLTICPHDMAASKSGATIIARVIGDSHTADNTDSDWVELDDAGSFNAGNCATFDELDDSISSTELWKKIQFVICNGDGTVNDGLAVGSVTVDRPLAGQDDVEVDTFVNKNSGDCARGSGTNSRFWVAADMSDGGCKGVTVGLSSSLSGFVYETGSKFSDECATLGVDNGAYFDINLPSESFTYIIYIVAFLLIANLICGLIYFYRKNCGGKTIKGEKYSVKNNNKTPKTPKSQKIQEIVTKLNEDFD
eukprot:382016_1